jgi:type VI secretion system FHA domain protein
MSLTLSVLTYRNQPPPRTISKTFLDAGGTIGRLEQNDLALPDPERTISRTHARVEFRDGGYFVTGLGQNPIELNGHLIAPGSSARLASGDRMVVGEYCIVAELAPASVPQASPFPAKELGIPEVSLGLPDDLGGLLSSGDSGSLSAFGIDLGGGASTPAPASDLRALDQNPIVTLGTQRDQVPGFLEPLPAAKPVGTQHIPDDYDPLRSLIKEPPGGPDADDPFGPVASVESRAAREPEPVPARAPAPPPPAAVPPVAIPAPTAAGPVRTEPAADYAQAVRTMLQAAGVPELEERVLADPEFPRLVGGLLHEAIGGLLRALLARALTRRELRVTDMTILATTENNPLKFSPDAGEALTHLLENRPRKGYLPPVRAVREAYDDLQAHNLAVMAGTRAALLEVLQRFDPARLEKRLESGGLLDRLLPQNRKARMWDLTAQQHADLVREAQDEFDRLFGRAFRAAYEEQLRKLRAAGAKGPR